MHKEFEFGFVGAFVAAAAKFPVIKKTGGEIEFSPRVEVWVLAPKTFGAVKCTNELVLLFLR